ncbi:hypothetical protein HS088_TW14G00570 [Tripterygium wilfordii]|uniref:Transmembrane protein n=1 Tax=Tripterygium wilfordii TaxID=458696 RepID=A0A7J7CQZ1_TRIWF|nr:uncharacterized protein LOC120014115 [Tripterygium wilfordii]KAF5736428.1 hypothetical protein HS088_TW14G00570 [Tripterygium wilfordii]
MGTSRLTVKNRNRLCHRHSRFLLGLVLCSSLQLSTFLWGPTLSLQPIYTPNQTQKHQIDSPSPRSSIPSFDLRLYTPTVRSKSPMASSARIQSIVLFALVSIFAAAVSAQDFDMAPAPAPSQDKGAGYSLGMSGAVICSSLVLSLLALLKH